MKFLARKSAKTVHFHKICTFMKLGKIAMFETVVIIRYRFCFLWRWYFGYPVFTEKFNQTSGLLFCGIDHYTYLYYIFRSKQLVACQVLRQWKLLLMILAGNKLIKLLLVPHTTEVFTNFWSPKVKMCSL